MNIVVFSYNFLPMSDAESFCTTRFCSALAEIGHNVHVVTMDHPQSVSSDVYNQLVNPKLTITRIPFRRKGKYNFYRLRYLTAEWSSCNFGLAIKTLGNILEQYKNPILISRSFPESSHIISWHVRHRARNWIAHFSDPIPFRFGTKSIKGLIWDGLTRYWMRKTILGCDAISLTCNEANLFYQDAYGKCFEAKPVFITQHIGNPPLQTPCLWQKPFTEKMIVHSGMLNRARGLLQILDALDEINKNSKQVRFIQVGSCDRTTKGLLQNRRDADVFDSVNPDLAASIVKSSDVSLISDVQVPMSYTPFLPSKFVYQLFSEKPLVLYSKPGSPMWRLFSDYPNAGLFVADYTKPQTLVEAIKSAIITPSSNIVRIDIRKGFDNKEVARNFISQVTKII